MSTNKRKNIDISSFLDHVKADQAPKPDRAGEAPVEYGRTQESPQATERTAAKPGRPKRTQTALDKQRAKLVYLDPDTEMQLRLVKTLQGYDYKEIIFAALHRFLEAHCDGQRLDGEGQDIVESTIDQFKIRN